MFKRLLILLLLVGVVGAVNAQDAPPLPDDIFDDAVEILEVYPVADNAERTLSIYNEDGWLTLPYPEYLSEIAVYPDYELNVTRSRITPLPDGQYFIQEPIEDSYSYTLWAFHPAYQGLYTIETPPCNAEKYNVDNPWVYVTLGSETFVCNWITGEISPPLADGAGWGATGYASVAQPTRSPDGRYLILRSAFENASITRYDARIYSYEIATETFRVIGDIPESYEKVGFAGWLTPTIFSIGQSEMPEWSTRNLYVGHADEVNSLHFAINKLRFYPRIMSDPPGLQVMDADMEDGATPGPCFLEVYDAASREINRYDTGALCEYGIAIPDGSGDQLFRAVYPDAAVVRYNVYTGVRRSLFTGEIEVLGAVSPDGRRAIIALGQNGIIDIGQDANEIDVTQALEAMPLSYVVMDLTDGTIAGRVTAEAEWLTGSHLYDPTQLYSITDAGITPAPLPGQLVLALETGKLLLKPDGQTLALYDPTADSLAPVAAIPTGYEVSAIYRDADVIQILFHSAGSGQPLLTFDVGELR